MSSDYNAVTAFLAFRLETEAPPHWYRVLTRFSRGPRFREDKEESRLVEPQIIRFEVFPPSSPGPYILSANNYIWTLALVRWAINQTSHKADAAETAVTFVNESFRESGDLHNKLLYREPAVLNRRSVVSSPALRLVSIVMPYFYSASWGYVRNRKLAPTASTVHWGGDKSPKEVHLPLTLDEYCNPWLTPKTLLGRNQDQVVWRYERERILRASPHPDPGFMLWEYNDDGKLVSTKPQSESRGIVDTAQLLMVHQVWIYLVDYTLVVAFPENVLKEGSVEAALSMGGSDLEPLTVKRPLYTFSAFINLLEMSVLSGLSESPLRLFQKSIVGVAEQVEAYFKGQSPEDQVTAATDEKEYFRIISDIREELSMILSVAHQQEEKPTKRIERLDKDAERVQALIPQILDLKRSYVAMKESHWTAVTGVAILGFTVVTIIFTPLIFVVALLAVPGDTLLMGKHDHKHWFITKVTVATEFVTLAVTAAIVVVAYLSFKAKTNWKPVSVSWWKQKLEALWHSDAPKAEKVRPGLRPPDIGPPDGTDAAAAARKRRGLKQPDLEEGQGPAV
ncbi:hypothetical protein B0A54_05017 [Friedmanniomyces endolithicus]|uniref:Uncharacterized protein n=1 Tax=Friedmanniomyces endolithicus TaxID=329885 RepID=A0A4U0V6C5_9PEZI|nr:hypothetical protein LTS09_003492 [Friedmanniomyces endolithicus]TKA44274.1 hypothetical protein B0A54_05017 [Friedmanniomyces endolithicus]